MRVVAVIFAVVWFVHVAWAVLPVDEPVIPSWASASTLTGIQCSCDSTTIELEYAATTTVNEILCMRYNTSAAATGVVIPQAYNCSCFGRTVQCGLLPTLLQFTGSPSDCSTYSMTTTTSFSSTTPSCVDAFGGTCGGLAGTRTDTRVTYVYNASSPAENVYCRKDIVKADCTNGLCTSTPILCQLNTTIQPWGECQAISGSCLKTRVTPILVEASPNAPQQCPSLADRTEYTSCTSVECAKLLCKYETRTVTGACNATCGPSVRTTTVYNVSLTNLEDCIAPPYSYVISETDSTCVNSPPCNSEGDPYVPYIFSYGNAGLGGASPAGIYVSLGGFEVTFDCTPWSMAQSFTIRDKVFRRVMPINPSGIAFFAGDGAVELPFLIGTFDGLGATGYLYEVIFNPPEGVHCVIYQTETGFPFPPFKFDSLDTSPPSLVTAVCPPGEDGLMTLVFSEHCAPPYTTDPIPASAFTVSGMTIIGATVSPMWTGTRTLIGVIEVEGCTPLSSSIRLNAGAVADAGGFSRDTDSPIIVPASYTAGNVMPDAYQSSKLYSYNNSGYADSAVIQLQYPVLKTALDKVFSILTLFYYPYVGGVWTGDVIPVSATSVWYDTSRTAEAYVNQFAIGIDPLAQFDKVYTDPTSEQVGIVQYQLGIPYAFYQSNVITLPIGYGYNSNQWGGQGFVLLGQAPSILQAFCYIGQKKLFVVMSKRIPSSLSFTVDQFSYSGNNSISSIANVYNSTVVELTMTKNYTFDMIVGVERIAYNATYTTSNLEKIGAFRWKYTNITVANGTVPSVYTSAISADTNYSTISSFTIYFNTGIDPSTLDTNTIGVFKNQLIAPDMSVSNITVAADNMSALINVTATCTGSLCFGTSVRAAKLRVTSGVTDPYGNAITAFEAFANLDLAPPNLVKVICNEPNTDTLTTLCRLFFSEGVSSINEELIQPRPKVACVVGSSTSIVCKYAANKRPYTGTTMYLKSGSVAPMDTSNNTMLTGKDYGVKLQSVFPHCDCGSITNLPASLYQFLIAAGIIGGLGVLAGIGLLSKLAIEQCIKPSDSSKLQAIETVPPRPAKAPKLKYNSLRDPLE